MIIGVPKEIKKDEYRVALRPVGAEILKKKGHKVLVEKGAGIGSGFTDAEYRAAGAQIIPTAKGVFAKAEMIIKVKEPQPVEIRMIRKGQIVFTYFHFAASRSLTEGMAKTGAISIAYETMEDYDGTLPLLTPMSEVAGRMATQEGAKYLERPMGGLARQCLEHDGNHGGLAHSLTLCEGQGAVLVGVGTLRDGHEFVPRHSAESLDHTRVANLASTAQTLGESKTIIAMGIADHGWAAVPGYGVDPFTIGGGCRVIEHAVPPCLVAGIVGNDSGRAFDPAPGRIVTHQVPIIICRPDAVPAI